MSTTEENGYRVRKCHPSHNSLIEKTGMSQTSISRGIKYLKELQQDGITEITKETKKKPRFLTTIQRMGTSAKYVIRYKLHTHEKTELPTHDNSQLHTHDNSELPTHEKTELPTHEKQIDHDNKQIEHTILTDDMNHQKNILECICKYFHWNETKIDEYILKYAENKHFTNELILIACHQFKREKNGERYWTKNYWPRGLDRWMEDTPSPRSAVNDTLVAKVHSDILHNLPTKSVKDEKEDIQVVENIDDDCDDSLYNDLFADAKMKYEQYPSLVNMQTLYNLSQAKQCPQGIIEQIEKLIGR